MSQINIIDITGTSGHMDVHCGDGRVARFAGELIENGFWAYGTTFWLETHIPLTPEEREELKRDVINCAKKIVICFDDD